MFINPMWGLASATLYSRACSLFTTAILPNRRRDKARVECLLGLPEFGDKVTEFLKLNGGKRLAVGYNRIVYGDHGPYIEFTASQINWDSFPHVFRKSARSYFD